MENLFGLGPHAGYIVVCYLVAALVVAGLILWVRLDHVAQTRSLADLEARGLRRRSARAAASASLPEESTQSAEGGARERAP